MTKTLEIDGSTGKQILREMTDEEQKSYDFLIEQQKAKDKLENTIASNKAILFDKLGITEAEATLLLS
ncbi:hypothetical protein UFOVP489_14 [uncultured Caudovirales phage]|uniref:Uncharacterized protein n=1 Tax=uncultured Caudovirales phage TaxID=2100421 RepID=A0A6J5RB71_9CAUD|nr:hypothetical protein UFOVP489_14 [uncultured Caudovirales phage]CAB4190968.1 hypothetical protein UFOVP1218_5 [uncultured Caudovirales phage]